MQRFSIAAIICSLFILLLVSSDNVRASRVVVTPEIVEVTSEAEEETFFINYTSGNLEALTEAEETTYDRCDTNSEIIFTTPKISKTEESTDCANPIPSSNKSTNYISDSDLKAICKSVGAKYGISATLLRAIVWCESGNYIYAKSYCGAKGLAQIMECYNRDRMSRLGITDIYDPYSNIMLCADIISSLRNSKYGYSDEFVLMAYNMGEYGARKKFESGYISGYAKKVLKTYNSML